MSNPLCDFFVKRLWDGLDVHVLPDDDDDARLLWQDDIIDATPQGGMMVEGRNAYVRKTTWERIKAEFESIGKRH